MTDKNSSKRSNKAKAQKKAAATTAAAVSKSKSHPNNKPFVVSAIFSLLGILDVVLRVWYIGLQRGLISAINDPGKCFFHIVILPMIVYLLMRVPLTSRGLASFFEKPAAKLILPLLLAGAAVQVADETNRVFFQNNSYSEDLAEPTARAKYQKARDAITQMLRVRGTPEEMAQRRKTLIDEHDLAACVPEEVTNLSTFTNADARSTAYKRSELLTKDDIGFGGYFRQASTRQFTSALLHFSGNCVVAWLFFAVCCTALPTKKAPSEERAKQRDTLLLMVALFSLWLPLRYYSEWYLQFYADQIIYPPLQLAAYLSIVATIVVFVRSSVTIFASIAPAAVAVINALFVILFQQNSKFFRLIAEAYRDAGPSGHFVIHVVAGVAFYAIGQHIYQVVQEDGEKALPTPDEEQP